LCASSSSLPDPFKNKDSFIAVDSDMKPDEAYEDKYKKLKQDIAPYIADLFNIHKDDLV